GHDRHPAPEEKANEPNSESTEREARLLKRIEELERRLAEVEAKLGQRSSVATDAEIAQGMNATANVDAPPPSTERKDDEENRQVLEFFRGTTLNLLFDGYYSYNFNRPA